MFRTDPNYRRADKLRRRIRRRGHPRVLTSVRTAARNFDLLLAIATPSTSVPNFSRGWNDSDSVWRQQGGPLFSLSPGEPCAGADRPSGSGKFDYGRIVHWKADRPKRILGTMSESGHRSCGCGAVYDRSEHIAEAREISSFECVVCGKTIENWNSAWVPRYRFIACPARESDSHPNAPRDSNQPTKIC